MPSNKDMKALICLARMGFCTLFAAAFVLIDIAIAAFVCCSNLTPWALTTIVPVGGVAVIIAHLGYCGGMPFMKVQQAVAGTQTSIETQEGKANFGGKPI